MKKRLALASLTASVLALSAGSAFADYTLNILHINDWHSRIESINKYDSTCSTDDETEGKCFGGAARLVTAVRDRRAALNGENILFLNAGDNFQGSLFYTTYKGAVEAEFMNLMKTDAMVVGNHEFDDGEDGLATFLDKVEFPVLGSNVKATQASALGDRVKQYVIVESGGEKVAIVGAVANDTAELSSPGEHVSIINDVEGITEAVKAAMAEGANKVIALTHVGYPRDLAAIAKIPGVDVVVGGHSNTFLSNIAENAEGPYPTMVDNPEGYKVPVVQAASYSKYLGDLKVVFDDEGVVKEASGEPHLIDASVTPDEDVLARVAELGGPIEELKTKVVAETSAPIDGSRENCRAGECEMGNLVADAMLDRTREQGVQFAITNGGGLRASIDEGEVTMGEVLGVLPFQNTLSTFQIKGADIVASLEGGVSQLEDGAGRFPQVSGLRYAFDASVAPNEGRIKSVEVMEDGAWSAIDPDKTYLVATNNFMRGGGDGYKLFADNAEKAYDYGPGLEQVLADYLAKNRPYEPHLDGRITKVPAAAATAEEKAVEGAEAMKDAATDKAGEVMEKAAEGAEAAKEAVSGAASDAAKATGEAMEKAAEGAEVMKDAATEKAGEIMEKAAEGAEAAKEAVSGAASDAAKATGEAMEKAAEGAEVMKDAATEKAGEFMEKAAEGAEAAKDTMGEAASDAAKATGEAMEKAAEGAETMKDTAAEKAGEVMEEKPAEDASADGAMMKAEGRTHEVMAGDTLWDLAKTYYGKGGEWQRIVEANPGINANDLEVGTTISVPEAN